MSIFINQLNALDIMAEIEGERWKTEQNGDPDGMCSFNAFAKAFWEFREYAKELDLDNDNDEPTTLTVDGNGAIYGVGGWHRYAVRSTGEIIFLGAFTSNIETLALAEKLGFTIWGDWRNTRSRVEGSNGHTH